MDSGSLNRLFFKNNTALNDKSNNCFLSFKSTKNTRYHCWDKKVFTLTRKKYNDGNADSVTMSKKGRTVFCNHDVFSIKQTISYGPKKSSKKVQAMQKTKENPFLILYPHFWRFLGLFGLLRVAGIELTLEVMSWISIKPFWHFSQKEKYGISCSKNNFDDLEKRSIYS